AGRRAARARPLRDRRRAEPRGARPRRRARLRQLAQAGLTRTDHTARDHNVELFDTTQLSLAAALRGADARQAALAGNLANVDTPGYARRDVDFHATLQAVLGAGADPSGAAFTAQPDTAAPARADGNSVDVDAEHSAR